MPLRVIREVMNDDPQREVMNDDPQRAARVIELEDRILERARQAGNRARVSRRRAQARGDVARTVLARLEELDVLTPSPRGYDADDIAIIKAISRFPGGGYEAAVGFPVYDIALADLMVRYREALTPVVQEEVKVLLQRLAAEVDVERARQIISSGAGPLSELVGAMHSKLLLAEIRRRPDARR